MVDEVLSERWREADVPPRLMGTLEYLHALTRTPNEVGPEHVDAALAAGASPGALEQATLMVMLFSYMNRMVDAFGADVTPEQAELISNRLDTVGGTSERLAGVKPWERLAGATPPQLLEMRDALRNAEGDSPSELRTQVEAYVAGRSGGVRPDVGPPPGALKALVDTLAEDAHGVTEAHIEAVKADGWSEEAIYEVIFTASFAAGLGRMERATALLAER